MESILIVLSIPIFFAFIGVELLGRAPPRPPALPLRRLDRNLGNGIGEQIIGAFAIPITVGIYVRRLRPLRASTTLLVALDRRLGRALLRRRLLLLRLSTAPRTA